MEATQKISCPECNWAPSATDRWSCRCGMLWNTFDTGGQCPKCRKQWRVTACLSCRASSRHRDWYHAEGSVRATSVLDDVDFNDPISLFYAGVDAMSTEKWLDAASLCDQASLQFFKGNLVRQVTAVHRPATLEFFMKQDPRMPRAMAEYLLGRQEKHADPLARMRAELRGVDSVEMLVSLDPIDVFARWLDGQSPRRQLEQLVEGGQLRPEALIGARARSVIDSMAIGSVPDGDDVVHVIFRPDPGESGPVNEVVAATMTADELALNRLIALRGRVRACMCVRQGDGSWRLVAGHEFVGGAPRVMGVVRPSSPRA